jgi:anti-anti-sigma factor
MEENKIKIGNRHGYLWVVLPDAINMNNCREIESAIETDFNGKEYRVVLDLSETVNVFSSCLGLMIRIRKVVHEKNGVVCLVNVSERIRNLLVTINLDKVFPVYATDTEFEISQSDVWKMRASERGPGFIFVSQVENNVCRINLSGELASNRKTEDCSNFNPVPDIKEYIIDLSGLEMIDSYGSAVFQNLIEKINISGGKCRVFGADELITETIHLLGADLGAEFFSDEQAAVNSESRT